MLKFKTSCAVLAYLSSNLLNEVGLSLYRYFEVGLRVCDIVVKKFTFAISSPDEFLLRYANGQIDIQTRWSQNFAPQLTPISRKWYKTVTKLQQKTNRKSYVVYWSVLFPLILSVLVSEGHLFQLLQSFTSAISCNSYCSCRRGRQFHRLLTVIYSIRILV